MKLLWCTLLLSINAFAYDTYPNAACEQPTFDPGSKTFYLDPVNGKATNDGLSPSTAFPGLEAVVNSGLIDAYGWQSTVRTDSTGKKSTYYGYPDTAAGEALVRKEHVNKNWKIPDGATLILMTGDHGNPILRGYMHDKLWTKITTQAGYKPILHSISFAGGSRWVLDGLTFELAATKTGISISEGGFYGPTSQFVIANNQVYTPGIDAAKMKGAAIKPLAGGAGIFVRDMQCGSVLNNKTTYTQSGINLYSNRMSPTAALAGTSPGETYILVRGNEVGYILGQDGFDYAGSWLWIDNNYVHDIVDTGTGLHYDGMQGQPNSGSQTQLGAHLKFTNNIIARQTDKSILSPGYMQGLDTFDGQWDDVLVQNNLIVTSHYHGITFYGGSNITIDHNTYLPEATPGVTTGGAPNQPWIQLGANKAGYIGKNFTVTNNVGYQMFGLPDAATSVSQGNVMWGKVFYVANGVVANQIKAGTYPNGNIVLPTLLKEFPKFDQINMKWDVSGVLPASPVYGKGYQPPTPTCK